MIIKRWLRFGAICVDAFCSDIFCIDEDACFPLVSVQLEDPIKLMSKMLTPTFSFGTLVILDDTVRQPMDIPRPLAEIQINQRVRNYWRGRSN